MLGFLGRWSGHNKNMPSFERPRVHISSDLMTEKMTTIFQQVLKVSSSHLWRFHSMWNRNIWPTTASFWITPTSCFHALRFHAQFLPCPGHLSEMVWVSWKNRLAKWVIGNGQKTLFLGLFSQLLLKCFQQCQGHSSSQVSGFADRWSGHSKNNPSSCHLLICIC